MSIIDYGDRVVVVGKDGKEVEIPTNSFAINGQKLYDYNLESGVLQVNRGMLSAGDLEEIMGLNKSIPPEGISVVIPLPYHQPARLQGIKKIEYLPDDRVLVPQQQAHEPSNSSRYTLFQRLINYARGK